MKKLSCILLIDDNFNDNFYHSVTIRELGAVKEVKTARDGRKALEYFEHTTVDPGRYPFPDLIFLDLQMPTVDGFAFLQKMKNIMDKSAKMPVIVVLTSSLSIDNERIIKERFTNEVQAFVNKPLTAAMLKNIINSFF